MAEVTHRSEGDAAIHDQAVCPRIDLQLKRPVVSFGMVRRSGIDANMADAWPLLSRALPFLRAGASAVVGPWWPTSAVLDRVFCPTMYDLLTLQ